MNKTSPCIFSLLDPFLTVAHAPDVTRQFLCSGGLAKKCSLCSWQLLLDVGVPPISALHLCNRPLFANVQPMRWRHTKMQPLLPVLHAPFPKCNQSPSLCFCATVNNIFEPLALSFLSLFFLFDILSFNCPHSTPLYPPALHPSFSPSFLRHISRELPSPLPLLYVPEHLPSTQRDEAQSVVSPATRAVCSACLC